MKLPSHVVDWEHSERRIVDADCVREKFVPHVLTGDLMKIRNVTAAELCEQSVQEADQMSVLHVWHQHITLKENVAGHKISAEFRAGNFFLWHPGWCEALWVHSYQKNNSEFHFSYGSSEVLSDAWLHPSHCAAILVKNLIPTIPSYHIFQIISTSGSLQDATVGWNVITFHSYKKVNRMCQQVSQLYQTRTSRGASCKDRTTGASVYVKKGTASRVTRLGCIHIIFLQIMP
jgi:hypothetical protein